MQNNRNIWGPPSRMSENGETPKLAPIAAPSAPTPQAQQPGVIQQKATDYATKQGMGFMDDTIMPWMQQQGTEFMGGLQGTGTVSALTPAAANAATSVAPMMPGLALEGGAVAGANAITTGALAGGSTAAATGSGLSGLLGAGGAGAGGLAAAAPALMAAAPWVAGAYGLYRLLK